MKVDGPSIGVVDYGMGNRRSAEKALEHVGARVEVSGDPERLGRYFMSRGIPAASRRDEAIRVNPPPIGSDG